MSPTLRAAVLHVESTLLKQLPQKGQPKEVDVPFWDEVEAQIFASSVNMTFGGLLPAPIADGRLSAIRDALLGLKDILDDGEDDLVRAWVRLLADLWCDSACFVNWLVENPYGTKSLPPDDSPYYVRLRLLPPPEETLRQLKDAAGVKSPPVVLDPPGQGATVRGKVKSLSKNEYALVARLVAAWPERLPLKTLQQVDSNANRTLKRLCAKDKDWEGVIEMAGSSYHGYRIVDNDLQ